MDLDIKQNYSQEDRKELSAKRIRWEIVSLADSISEKVIKASRFVMACYDVTSPSKRRELVEKIRNLYLEASKEYQRFCELESSPEHRRWEVFDTHLFEIVSRNLNTLKNDLNLVESLQVEARQVGSENIYRDTMPEEEEEEEDILC